MSELKPCPCCNGISWVYYRAFTTYVYCDKCGLRTKAYNTEAEAIEAWNTRYERTCKLIKHAARDEESGIELVLYECGQCGWIVDPSRNESYCPNCGARVKEE